MVLDNTLDAADFLDLIDKYLRNELTGKELLLFEERLQKEPALSREVELQRKLILKIKEAEIVNILQRTRQDVDKGRRDPFRNSIQALLEPELSEASFYRLKSNSLETDSSPKMTTPAHSDFIAIPYEGDAQRAFPVNYVGGKAMFQFVRILSPTDNYTFHYRIMALGTKVKALILIGEFDVQSLTLIYRKREGQQHVKLRIGNKEYYLKEINAFAPLTEEK